ncbi:MAG: glucokinase [Thermoanaerobaculia bacterium]
MLLAADIGGTKSTLALFEGRPEGLRLVREATFRSREFPGIEPLVASFLETAEGTLEAACFGVAGPVLDNHAVTPNLPWNVDGKELARAAGIPRLELIGDLVATAAGIPLLNEDEVVTLQAGRPRHDGSALVLAAGTGLGAAILPGPDGAGEPLPSEAGHMDFAPRNEEEIGLLRFLAERFGSVSLERVLSGPGLVHLYQYVRERSGRSGDSSLLAELEESCDPGRVIGEAAATGRCPSCVRALELFVDVFGAAAGNLALATLATRGVYLGGGIPPKILPQLRAGRFLDSFVDKGRFRGFLEAVPVYVLRNPKTALLGAGRRAALLAASNA